MKKDENERQGEGERILIILIDPRLPQFNCAVLLRGWKNCIIVLLILIPPPS